MLGFNQFKQRKSVVQNSEQKKKRYMARFWLIDAPQTVIKPMLKHIWASLGPYLAHISCQPRKQSVPD